jgi:membrane protease subunit HflK
MSDQWNFFRDQLRYNWNRYRRRAIAGAIVVVGILAANSVLYSVEADEEAVVLRFGRHHASTGPGLHAKMPWPVDKAIKVQIERVRTAEFGFRTLHPGQRTIYARPDSAQLQEAEMLTGDLNLAHVEWIVQYRIHDAAKYLFRIAKGEDAPVFGGSPVLQEEAVEETIRLASESIMRQLVGDVSVDVVLTTGRELIASKAKVKLQGILDGFDCGITVVTVKLQNVAPPEPVKDAFDSVNRARQIKERIVNEARGERNRQIPEARGKRDRAIAEAEGYRERTTRQATGQASAFLSRWEEYAKAPEVTRTRLYLEAMERLLSSIGDKLIIDDSVTGLLPVLNLNEVLKANQAEGGPR